VTQDRFALWAQNPIFIAAGEEVCQGLAKRYEPTIHAAGTVLIEAGEPADQVFVVLRGTVRIYQAAADGREVVVKLLRAPAIFCDLEMLAGLPMVKNVAAVDEVQVAAIPAQDYLDLLYQHPSAMMAHMEQIAVAFCVAARNQRLIFASLEQKVSNLLLSYAEFFGEIEGDELVITRPLSQPQIARSLGAVTRSVANVLSDLTKKGLISKRKDRFLVHKIDKLEELAAPIRGSLNFQMGMSLEHLAQEDRLGQAELEVLDGAGSLSGGRQMIESQLIIGRAQSCQLQLPCELVSERHCRVFRGATGSRFWIEDLSSESGTWVNDKRVRRAVLRQDDLIRIGSIQLRVHLGARH
jgi:CRP-like cAMP-binding protein